MDPKITPLSELSKIGGAVHCVSSVLYEVKIRIVQEYLGDVTSRKAMARKHNIAPGQLATWQKQYEQEKLSDMPGKSVRYHNVPRRDRQRTRSMAPARSKAENRISMPVWRSLCGGFRSINTVARRPS